MLIIDMPIEADLVDRRVLLHNLEIWQDSVRGAESLAFLHLVKMLLASAPHIKAKELVRCGECEYHGEPHRTDMGVDVVWCNFYNTHKLKDGYCNCGERCVLVVECRDCKYWHKVERNDGKVVGQCLCDTVSGTDEYCDIDGWFPPNFFCANGERKDGDEQTDDKRRTD